MVENTDEEYLDNLTNIQSENISNENISASESDLTIPNPENENMEVHAQELHKAPGHGWKHYFFEFFMLFLAVLCGFLQKTSEKIS